MTSLRAAAERVNKYLEKNDDKFIRVGNHILNDVWALAQAYIAENHEALGMELKEVGGG